MKRFVSMLLVFAMLLAMGLTIAGCSGGGGETTPMEEDDLSVFVELDYWFPVSSIPNDLRDIQDDLNVILKEKLNCKLNLHAVGIGDYESTMLLKINTQDEFDICYTSPWMNNYADNVRREAFIALDNLLPEYAPTIWNTISSSYWDAARINGKIYGIINQQILPRSACISIDAAKAKAAGFDISTVTCYEDLEPFLEYCKSQGDTDIVNMFDVQAFLPYFGWDDLGGSYKIPGFISATDGTLTVFNQYETEEWQSMMALGASWYEKGYFREDILTSFSNLNKISVRFPTTYKPGIEAEEVLYTGREFEVQQIGDWMTYGSWVIGTMNAISQTSRNPIRALQVLELLYTDVDVYNLLVFGEEGVHYNKVGENRIELTDNTGYQMPSGGWMFGNQFNLWLQPSQADDVWERTEQINNSSSYSTAYGFSFDPTNVKTEIANCVAVYDEYYLPLLLGLYGDNEAKYQEFLGKLEAAGASAIIAEKQRQINEWLSANE